MVRTTTNTEAGTPDSSDDEYFMEPPCREAARHVVACPICGRRLQIKTLRYSHVCGRSFNALERAAEQKKAAEAAVMERARVSQPKKQATEQPLEQKQRDYANLIKF